MRIALANQKEKLPKKQGHERRRSKSKRKTLLDRYVTTYNRDYKSPSEHHLPVIQLKPGTEATAAPAFINPPQTHNETWPIVKPYFYKTTNSIYGSSIHPQPPSCSLVPASLQPFGILAPSMSTASAVIGSSLTEARTQEKAVARENGPLICKEVKGQLHYVFGGKANVLEQLEAKDELQQETDVLYEEGVIALWSRVCPACCEDYFRSVCREAGLQHLLHLPVTHSAVITVTDAENWDNCTCLRDLVPAIGLKHNSFLQPTSRQCSRCAWETECPNLCCSEMQTFPPCICQSSMQPLARAQPTFYCTEPSRKLPLTEYQASYAAEWAQPKMQQSDIHHRHPSRHQILYPLL